MLLKVRGILMALTQFWMANNATVTLMAFWTRAGPRRAHRARVAVRSVLGSSRYTRGAISHKTSLSAVHS